MKKLIAIFSAIILVATSIAAIGCIPQDKDTTTINVAALKGPTGMGVAPLMDKSEYPNYNITIGSDPSAVASSFIAGDYDVAAVPVNLASTLYNKLDGDVVMLGVTTLGVLYVLENGNSVQSINDLAGKTLYATGQASTPEYIIEYLLDKNGLSDSVTVEYKTEHAELATLMATGSVALGMTPEPNATAALAKNSSLRVALDLTAEWDKVCDTELIQGVLIARRSFVNEHKEAIDELIADYTVATQLVNQNHDIAAQLIVEADIMSDVTLASNAISRCNIVFMTGADMKLAAAAMFDVLFAANPQSVGGKVPLDDMYYLG